MLNDIKKYDNRMFEEIKHIDEKGNEYWYARELQIVFEYAQWRRFENTINKAKTACNNSNEIIEDHFANIGKMINLGKGGTRNVDDYKLSRYACYLIAQKKLKKDNIKSESKANITHYNIGKIVRDAIKKAGGTMPEELPTPDKSLK